MLYSVLYDILMVCRRILSRLIDVALANTRRFDRIEGALKVASDERLFYFNQLDAKLDRILAAVEPLPAVKIIFTVEMEGQTTEGESIAMTNSQQATATIQPVDKKRQPAPVDGVPVWASSDETIITVTPAADGLSAVVAAVGPLGAAKVSVTADADLGAGVSSIFGSLDVTVTQGQAVGMTITLGDATEQGAGAPPPPPPPPPPAG